MTGLGDHAVFKRDEEGRKESGSSTAVQRAKGEVREWDSEDSEHCGHHAHRNVRRVRCVSPAAMSVGNFGCNSADNSLGNILEVELPVIAKDEPCEGNEELR